MPISQPTAAPAATSAPAPTTAAEPAAGAGQTLNGVTLPADAAPADQQVYVVHYDNTADFTTIDFTSRSTSAAARWPIFCPTRWCGSTRISRSAPARPPNGRSTSSGLVWTFYADLNPIWTDDTPVTADDYVATFRYAADPKHAWDFTWFFGGVIKNWDDVVAGKMPVDWVGRHTADAHTLQFETAAPRRICRRCCWGSMPPQKKALETHGGLYNSDPATSVSSGPFVLKEWRKGDRLVYEANPKYKGTNKPFIQKVVVIGAAPSTGFAAYQAGEIDFVSGLNLSPADNDIVSADLQPSKEFHPHYGDFRTDYLFFDTKNPPFDNLKVRQAFSHVIDRDGLIKSIIKPTQGIPAYSFLMPGFPASNSASWQHPELRCRDRQEAAGRGRLPGWQGLPQADTVAAQRGAGAPVAGPGDRRVDQAEPGHRRRGLEQRDQNVHRRYECEADPDPVRHGLVRLRLPGPVQYVERLAERRAPQLEQHAVRRPGEEGRVLHRRPERAIKMFQDAEKLLVEDVGGIFIYHRTAGDPVPAIPEGRRARAR